MKKALDSTILWELCNIAEEESVNFKKWFQDEVTTLESTQSKTYNLGIVPVTIYELLTVLPKILETRVGTFYLYMTHDMLEGEPYWRASYEDFEGERYEREEAPELVDALGKLLVKCIKKGFLR